MKNLEIVRRPTWGITLWSWLSTLVTGAAPTYAYEQIPVCILLALAVFFTPGLVSILHAVVQLAGWRCMSGAARKEELAESLRLSLPDVACHRDMRVYATVAQVGGALLQLRAAWVAADPRAGAVACGLLALTTGYRPWRKSNACRAFRRWLNARR